MNDSSASDQTLSSGDAMQLKRWNTPTIYNGWEQITKRNAGADAFNIALVSNGFSS